MSAIEGLRVHRHAECRRRRARRASPLRERAPRTRSAGPECSRGRCCAARSARPCAGSRERTSVGARRARTVDVGEAHDEVVYGLDRHACPAWAILIVNFCMSHAPVGQRSAQSPQCRQRSSSLTMMRPVLTGPTHRSPGKIERGRVERGAAPPPARSARRRCNRSGRCRRRRRIRCRRAPRTPSRRRN